jgi:hypothetical protein
MKTFIVRWAVRLAVLGISFWLHWAFGVFMLIGLFTHIKRVGA